VLCDRNARMALKICAVDFLNHLQDLGYDLAASLIDGDLSRDFLVALSPPLVSIEYDGRGITFVLTVEHSASAARVWLLNHTYSWFSEQYAQSRGKIYQLQ